MAVAAALTGEAARTQQASADLLFASVQTRPAYASAPDGYGAFDALACTTAWQRADITQRLLLRATRSRRHSSSAKQPRFRCKGRATLGRLASTAVSRSTAGDWSPTRCTRLAGGFFCSCGTSDASRIRPCSPTRCCQSRRPLSRRLVKRSSKTRKAKENWRRSYDRGNLLRNVVCVS